MGQEITPDDIKRIRGKYSLSQQSFARLLGLGEASIVRYENGQPPSNHVQRELESIQAFRDQRPD